jgi:hypothetical protein
MKISIKTQPDIRLNPLKDKCRMSMIIERSSLEQLKEIASGLNTTCNEIVRALIDEFISNTDRFLCDDDINVCNNKGAVKRLEHW